MLPRQNHGKFSKKIGYHHLKIKNKLTAKDAIHPTLRPADGTVPPVVDGDMPLGALLDMMVERGIGIVAVRLGDAVAGYADTMSMLSVYARLFPQLQESTELTVVIPASQYSASAIAHAVEDADAHLLNLNVVAGTTPNSRTTAEKRVNHSRGESVARSLERYGFEVIGMTVSGAGTDISDTTASRARALLHMLDL